MEEKKRKRRIHYLVNKSFQMKHAGIILVLMCLVLIVFAWTVYHSGWVPLTERLSDVYPQGRLVAILRVLKLQLAIRVLLLVPIIIIVSMFLSHKTVGPLARLERSIRAISMGNLQMRLKVRKGDALFGLTQAINEMVKNTEQILFKDRELIEKIFVTVEDLRASMKKVSGTPTEISEKIDSLSAQIVKLQKNLDSPMVNFKEKIEGR
ncbi:MAG: HAMP domain-containing protein [Candidatus Omnitrophica bacterium]|nr:HAMP domain-containing protein [Candidatus Omnitrophota bacterium]